MTDKPEEIGIDSKNPAERDRIDLNHEMAGLNSGRQQRFLSGDSHAFSSESKKKKAEREFRTLLDILLAEDPHYAALYKKVTEKLKMAQQAVDSALVDISQRLEASGRKLQLLRENAAELPDGTRVFRSNNGSIFTEHGKRLSDEKAKGIIFPTNAPSWEIFKAEKDAYDTAARQKKDVDIYQKTVLDPTTKRMNNEDDPPSKDELKELEAKYEGEMPDILKSYYSSNTLTVNSTEVSPSTSVAHDQIDKANLKTPNMGKSFDLARTDIPDLGNALDTKPAPVKKIN